MALNNVKVQNVPVPLSFGLQELIDADDTVIEVSGDYTKSVALTVNGGLAGTIVAAALASSPGAGAVQGGDGVLIFFNANPAISSGDAALASAAVHQSIIGTVNIVAADWEKDTAGGFVYKGDLNIPFPAAATIWMAFRNTDGTATWNSLAADNEELHATVFYTQNQK